MFTSPLPDVEIPTLSVYDYLFASLSDADLARVALVDGAKAAEITYGALRSQVTDSAGAVAAKGWGSAPSWRSSARTCPRSYRCYTASSAPARP